MEQSNTTYCGNSLFAFDLWEDIDKLDFLMFICKEGIITEAELEEIKDYYSKEREQKSYGNNSRTVQGTN